MVQSSVTEWYTQLISELAIVTTSSSIIDAIVLPDKISNLDVITIGISDHLLTFYTRKYLINTTSINWDH